MHNRLWAREARRYRSFVGGVIWLFNGAALAQPTERVAPVAEKGHGFSLGAIAIREGRPRPTDGVA